MELPWQAMIWRQFGAAIDMLGDPIQACPAALWHAQVWPERTEQATFSEFWYVAYHALFWLDLYLTGTEESFAPPPPFSLTEMEDNALPERPYTQDELRSYLSYCREKCRTTIESLTEEEARRICQFGWGEMSFAELLLYNMRHVQEHAAQLSLLLGQQNVSGVRWVGKARSQ